MMVMGACVFLAIFAFGFLGMLTSACCAIMLLIYIGGGYAWAGEAALLSLAFASGLFACTGVMFWFRFIPGIRTPPPPQPYDDEPFADEPRTKALAIHPQIGSHRRRNFRPF